MTIIQAVPAIYGQHYRRGCIGFVHHHSLISNLIMWFTRWWRKGASPRVSHVFVVSGADECIEANPTGVEVYNLSQYLDNPQFSTYFRKPIGWTDDLGNRIACEAYRYCGTPYDFELIAADAASYSIVGRIVDGLTGGELNRMLTALGDSRDQMICDKLAVLAMQAQPELRDKGTLIHHARTNNPQMLFEDEQIFSDRTYAVIGPKS